MSDSGNSDERTYKVEMLARVEGEGRFWLRLDENQEVAEARLSIFEAPRFFEAFLRGRSLFEVPDIVARICGICPVAYQMSSVRALERILGLDPPSAGIRGLRRLLYCGEWIESHVLHVFMLHAPDFLGYESAIEMAAEHRDLVERGLALKKIGNRIVEVLGGRAVHPVSPRVGGFTRTPTPAELATLRPELARGLDWADEALDWCASLDAPDFEQDYTFIALAGDRYPLEFGDELAIGDGRGPARRVAVDDLLDHVEEQHVEHSNALQCRLKDGRAYLVGPMARINHFAEQLHPRALAGLERVKLELPVKNPYASIVVRAIEVVHAFAEALDIVDGYTRRVEPAFVEAPTVIPPGVGSGCTEAPRGICWHRYQTDDAGMIVEARIIPPTSQNQARIEQDLIGIAPQLLALEHEAATRRCEQLIRSYDPCISCATHFLRLEIER